MENHWWKLNLCYHAKIAFLLLEIGLSDVENKQAHIFHFKYDFTLSLRAQNTPTSENTIIYLHRQKNNFWFQSNICKVEFNIFKKF